MADNPKAIYSGIEIEGEAEALDIASDDGEEIGIWIPCSREVQELLDGQLVSMKIFVRDE